MSAVSVRALGVVVRLACTPELEPGLRAAWGPLVVADDVTPDVDVEPVPDGVPVRAALELMTQRVTVEALGRRAGELLMLHACALADPVTGAAVVLVGPSGMGKTTIAATLGRHFGYVTDETAAVAADGTLVAYPKPLSVVTGDGKEQVSPAALGLQPAPEGLRVRAVLLLDRQPSAPGVTVEPVDTVRAVAALAEHTSYLARLERPLQRVADLLRSTGGLRRVTYAEAADLEPLLGKLLGGGSWS